MSTPLSALLTGQPAFAVAAAAWKPASSMPSTTAAWLDAASDLRSVTVLGGTGVVGDLVAGRAQRAVLQ